MANAEPFLNLKEAAQRLQRPYHQLQKAVRDGRIPSYRPFGRRPLVRLSEVVAVIEASRVGGADAASVTSASTRDSGQLNKSGA